MNKIYKNTLELINNTPLVELVNIEKKYNLKSKIFAKVEMFNLGGSIKSRVALNMLVNAKKKGLIKDKATIIEPTSGNTGIGLALVSSLLKYKFIATMPSNMSKERILLIKAYGGDVVLTDPKLGMKGAIDKANELHSKIKNSFIPSQFNNKDNYLTHYKTTGKEIYDSLNGKINYFISTIGTGGTITGTAKFLKEKNKNIKVIGIEPKSSPLITKGKIGSHKIQGIGANFIPKILDLNLIDKVTCVSDLDAYKYSNLLAIEEGLFTGISSGATLKIAIDIAKTNKNKNIVIILPDTGERYLSSGLIKD